ncbi:MAG: hypothetical protein HRU15_01515 [Planctomycetes bacterium]|nr:hypothetical protein [Planctomycetota bacterium]
MEFPYKLATNAKQVAGSTYIISESTWVSPMSRQSEAPFLIATYSSLNGMDCYYWFALGAVGYDSAMKKWQAANPSIMGGWPAASLMFRKGFIKQGEPAVHEERALEGDMWELRSPTIVEEAGFDQNRDKSVSPMSAIKSAVPPLAYLVGPVEVVYDGDPSKSTMADFDKYIKGNVITSNTGEIVFDMDKNLCTLNAPCAQGASGFLKKAGSITCDALEITSENEYATVLAVSLDGKPISSAKKVFLQITTTCRPYGWKEKPSKIEGVPAMEITSVGTTPWNVWDTKMSVTIKNKKLKKVTVLDANLYPTIIKTETKSANGGLCITPAKDVMYMIIE